MANRPWKWQNTWENKITKHAEKQNNRAHIIYDMYQKNVLNICEFPEVKSPFTMLKGRCVTATIYIWHTALLTYSVLETLHRYTDQAICSSQILLITFYAVTKKLSVKILASRLHKNTKSRFGSFLKFPLTTPGFSSHPGRISPHLLIWVT